MPTSLFEEEVDMNAPFVDSEVVDDLEHERVEDVAEKLQLQYKALRVEVTGIGDQRNATPEQKAIAASAFTAGRRSLSFGSKIWTASEPAVKALRAVISEINRVKENPEYTKPSTQKGLRMVRKNCIPKINEKLQELQVELADKAAALYDELPLIRERERQADRRGELFNAADYDFDPRQSVGVKWSFPMVTEDPELAQIDESVFLAEREQRRKMMADVVKATELEYAEKFCDMLDGMMESLEGTNASGEKKKISTRKIHSLLECVEFLDREEHETGLGGEGLTQARERLRSLLGNHDEDTLPLAMRRSDQFRSQFATQAEEIRDQLLESAVPVTRRAVLRSRSDQRRKPRKSAAA